MNTYGEKLKFTVFGESHGTGIGVVIDGFPSSVAYDEAFVLREMERRAPGRNKQSTQRKEADLPVIQSGIYNGKTTGTPICALIQNLNQRSGDYAELAAQPRPGHADYTGMVRYKSCNDPRGGEQQGECGRYPARRRLQPEEHGGNGERAERMAGREGLALLALVQKGFDVQFLIRPRAVDGGAQQGDGKQGKGGREQGAPEAPVPV